MFRYLAEEHPIAFVVDQLSPVLILLSGVITLGIMNNNNELLGNCN